MLKGLFGKSKQLFCMRKEVYSILVIWALFDSANGCYKQAVEKYFEKKEIEIYSIGIDMANKNSHFLHLDLADYSVLFGENKLFKVLDTLPKPDVILASPPCESWSIASSFKYGNNCWYTQRIHNLLGEAIGDNHFTIRTKSQIERKSENGFKTFWWKSVFSRINGELCAFNTIRIIEYYQPNVWVIENPQSSKIWNYYKQIHNFKGVENVAHYNAYDKDFPKKPTTFYSNMFLNLKTTRELSKVSMHARAVKEGGRLIRDYNERSNIPLELIKDILLEIRMRSPTNKM